MTLQALQAELLGRVDYVATWAAMREFTRQRDATTPDRLWICEHDPVFTQGVGGRAQHVHDAGTIRIVQTDRGGQVSYHGPGQVVAYPLIDLKRQGIYVKEFVYRLEHCVIKTLESYGVTGHRVAGAPGVYVRRSDPFGHAALRASGVDKFAGLGKVAALGIKLSRHRSYHGVALNVAMDLAPFSAIDPCGHVGLDTVDLATLGVHTDWQEAAVRLGDSLAAHLAP
ncbi:MAG: lipoyl(octanoyl) transferase LipB [Burkholderiaceae bacterium]